MTVDKILMDAGIDPIEPHSAPVASDQPSSEQSSRAASESDPSVVVDTSGANILAQDQTTICVIRARNSSSK